MQPEIEDEIAHAADRSARLLQSQRDPVKPVP
jgi:hypothetical protein